MEQQKTETRSITAEQRKRVEEVCFRSLALIGRNCEYLEQRLLAKLRPCLYEILLYHLNGLFLNYLYLRLLCLLWKYRRVRRFRSK